MPGVLCYCGQNSLVVVLALGAMHTAWAGGEPPWASKDRQQELPSSSLASGGMAVHTDLVTQLEGRVGDLERAGQ